MLSEVSFVKFLEHETESFVNIDIVHFVHLLHSIGSVSLNASNMFFHFLIATYHIDVLRESWIRTHLGSLSHGLELKVKDAPSEASS